MDFNEIMQNIMTFINEHTLLLIGICVFLILVLIGYLIDNSVKSKRIRNDIKNADQVPENIKEEIIKEAEVKGAVKVETDAVNENKNEVVDNKQEEIKPTIDLSSAQEEVNIENKKEDNITLDSSLNLDNSVQEVSNENELNLDASLNVQDANLDNLIGDNNSIFGADNNLNLTDKQADTLNFDLDTGIIQDTNEVDPDAFIMGSVVNQNNEYKNDKSLSEILSENVSLNNSVVEDNPLNIEINTNENNISSSNEPQDELEKIMQKLSSMKPETEEDNYTNIF